MLKIYSSRSWLPPGRERSHVTPLCPFWGRNENVGAAGWPDYADELIRVGKSFLELSDLDRADAAVFPLSFRNLLKEPEGLESAREFDKVARAAETPSVFFFDHVDTNGYIDGPFPIKNAIVLRGSLFRSRRTTTEFALPGFHEDLVRYTGGELPTRRKKGKSTVSFCGGVIREHELKKNLPARARRVMGGTRRLIWRVQGRHEEDLFIRAKAVDALLDQDHVDANVIVRESGGGGAWSRFDAEQWQVVRREFVHNMTESDYVLCPRGDGNWSVRLYEALCLGRIPIMIDTDCVLPYDFLLPWRDYCVWLDRSEVDLIGEKVATFHQRLSDDDFVDLQRECRRLWDDYLSPHGFFANFHRHFDLLQRHTIDRSTTSRQEKLGSSANPSST